MNGGTGMDLSIQSLTTKASGRARARDWRLCTALSTRAGGGTRGWNGLRSPPGQGTGFDIYLPAALRQLVRAVLEKQGYHALDAASGSDALVAKVCRTVGAGADAASG